MLALNEASLAIAESIRTIPPGMPWVEIIALVLAGTAAGMINAVAGGGTLLTFPVLLYFGTSPMIANATSTTALVIGTAGSIFSFKNHFPAVHHWLGRLVPVSLLGGWLGSLLLTRSGDPLFAALAPYLILFATVLFLLQEGIRKWLGQASMDTRPRHTTAPWLAVAFQFAVALYGGYFGAGIGILMLASLGFIGLSDIHQMNALKNLLGSLINLVAAAWFVTCGMVDWNKAGVMTVGALSGYYLGASLSQLIPRPIVRHAVTAIGFAISGVMIFRRLTS